MASVDPADIRQIGEFEMLDDPTLNTFGEMATRFTEHQLSDAATDPLIQDVSTWVGAHLSSMKQKRIESEEFTDAVSNYEGRTGMKLKFTRYGQQAIVLDYTNSLNAQRRYTGVTHDSPDYEKLASPGYPVEKYL